MVFSFISEFVLIILIFMEIELLNTVCSVIDYSENDIIERLQ